MRHLYSLFSLLIVFLVTPSVHSEEVAESRTGRPASRVVALTSLSADMVVSLDPTVLVGVPGTSLTKADSRFNGIKRVSSGRSQPSVEAIVALKPDLVIGAEGFHSKILTSLDALGIPSLPLRIDRWNRLENAAQLLRQRISNSDKLEKKLASICPAVSPSAQSSRQRRRALILVGVSPKLSPAAQSWSGSLLGRNGLINATKGLSGDSEFPGYITMSKERMLTVNADTVIAVNPSGGVEALRTSIQKYLPKVKNQDVVEMDYYGLINPGSLNSISSACQRLRSL